MAGDRSVWTTFTAVMSGEQKDKLTSAYSELIHLKDEAANLVRQSVTWAKTVVRDRHAIDANPKLLVDEPVAGMTHQEMDRTSELLNSLAGKHSVVVVEHDMDSFVRLLAMSLCFIKVTCWQKAPWIGVSSIPKLNKFISENRMLEVKSVNQYYGGATLWDLICRSPKVNAPF